MGFRSSFASVPLQVTFARGHKALAALTEHPLRRSAVQRLQLLSGISVRHQAGLNVAKQPDFSIRHRTLLRYRFVHVRRYHDSTCNAASAMPLPRHESTSSHGISTRSLRLSCSVRAPFRPRFELYGFTSSNRCQYFFGCVCLCARPARTARRTCT